jgi:hypothetical protein
MSNMTDEELQATKLQLIKKKLREVCSTDSDGYAVYADGWSDERVADEVNRELRELASKFLAEIRGR